MLRFAILKTAGNATEEVVLEYRDEQILSRLQARIRENLVESEKWFSHAWSKNDVAKALDKAFRDLVEEFKEETVKLPA